VLVADDDMKRMNVDQLDDAFRLSLVDASTLVWKAGMKTWQRLGAVAGIDDEPEESITRRVPPPPPPPIPAPRKAAAAPFAATVPNPFLAPPSSLPGRDPFAQTAANPFAVTAPAPYVSPFAAAPALKAPVYSPPLRAPDPYTLPKRRAALTSEVDFRRSSRGFRFGRWLVVGLLLTGGVLALYRQNLLREGARRVGFENKYLHGERRVTAYVDAKAPPALKQVLTRLALLPGPNALAPKPALARAAPAAATAAAVPPPVAAPAAEATGGADEVKTVALDALPVETAAPAAAPLHDARPTPVTKPAPKPAAPPRQKPVAKAEKPAKPATKAVAERPKAAPKPAPPPANENPLKAAIRSAIAADAAK
jgi:hypothetical protein